jgi:hypothetical protein
VAGEKTRRDVLRAAGFLGLGGLIWSAALRPAAGAPGRLPCERCPALTACSTADSLQARDALAPRARQAGPAEAGGLPRLCDTDIGGVRD